MPGLQMYATMPDLKRFLKVYLIQIKTILRVHLTPVRRAIIKKKVKNKYWWEKEAYTLLEGM
jgi:hypothetical protein